ncbi:hypothetical protein FGB62_28g131 [Gracilaria domingensis]|nr:hypothetical protein FGB62_28g131 [Gracilaria domingensis]
MLVDGSVHVSIGRKAVQNLLDGCGGGAVRGGCLPRDLVHGDASLRHVLLRLDVLVNHPLQRVHGQPVVHSASAAIRIHVLLKSARDSARRVRHRSRIGARLGARVRQEAVDDLQAMEADLVEVGDPADAVHRQRARLALHAQRAHEAQPYAGADPGALLHGHLTSGDLVLGRHHVAALDDAGAVVNGERDGGHLHVGGDDARHQRELVQLGAVDVELAVVRRVDGGAEQLLDGERLQALRGAVARVVVLLRRGHVAAACGLRVRVVAIRAVLGGVGGGSAKAEAGGVASCARKRARRGGRRCATVSDHVKRAERKTWLRGGGGGGRADVRGARRGGAGSEAHGAARAATKGGGAKKRAKRATARRENWREARAHYSGLTARRGFPPPTWSARVTRRAATRAAAATTRGGARQRLAARPRDAKFKRHTHRRARLAPATLRHVNPSPPAPSPHRRARAAQRSRAANRRAASSACALAVARARRAGASTSPF